MDAIIAFSVRNKLIIGLLMLIWVIWGVYSATKIALDAVPDITNNQVQVITQSPSLSPQEVEKFITFPIELAMANLQRKVEIRSISRYGLSVVTIVFEEDMDILQARQLVAEQLRIAEANIPPEFGKPEMMPITTGLGEIYQYVLQVQPGYESRYSPMELRTIQDWLVKRYLAGIPGIADVSSFGGFVKQYEVSVLPDRLRSFGLTPMDLFRALQMNNQNTGGSYMERGQRAFYIRAEGLAQGIADIEKIVVTRKGNLPVLVRDVATVQLGFAPRFGAMTKDGKGEVVGGITLMLKGANSSDAIANVKARVAQVQKILPEGIRIEPYLDRSVLVEKTIRTVARNLTEGGLIVIAVLVLMLGNLRAGLVVASVIPLSFLFALGMMDFFGVSANLMSLGAIDFGLIVDGAIIIVEAMMHRLHGGDLPHRLTKSQMDEQVILTAAKIRRSAAFGELIILMVYLPILALTGIEGKMFKPMAQTVGFAIFGALLLSFTYVPMASALFLSKHTVKKVNFSDRMVEWLHGFYRPVLLVALRHKALFLTLIAAIFAGCLWLFSRMGGEFIPTLDEGDLACQQVVPVGTSLSESVRTSLEMQKILLKHFPDEVKTIVAKTGSAEIPTDPMGVEDSDIAIVMHPREQWKKARDRETISNLMKAKLAEYMPWVSYEFTQPIQLRFNELMTGVKSDVAIKIFGEYLDVLAEKGAEAARLIAKIQGAGDVRVEQTEGMPQLVVRYKRDKVAQYGLSIEELNRTVQIAFAGLAAGTVYEGERRFDLIARLPQQMRHRLNDIANLYVNLPDGNQVLLREVADIVEEQGVSLITREDTRRRIVIGVNVRNRDVESFIGEVEKTLASRLKLPPGYSIVYGGQFENLQAAKARLSVAVPAALGLILILLYFTFTSIRQSLLIFSAVPLAAIGGILALWLRDMPFSISAGVGFIALFGVAVLNGIVLIGQFNHLKHEGIGDIRSRVLEGTHIRFRPILTTAMVAALGFLPMATSTQAGAEVQKPLATVVIGGLITALLLTLLVLPVLYEWAERTFERSTEKINPSDNHA